MLTRKEIKNLRNDPEAAKLIRSAQAQTNKVVQEKNFESEVEKRQFKSDALFYYENLYLKEGGFA